MKKLLLAALLLAAFIQGADARAVTVEGTGTDRAGAMRAAQRNAVEQAAGTLVDSKTIVQDARVALDEIYTRSQGFVTRVDVLSEGVQPDGAYKIVANIDVDTSPDAELVSQLQTVMNLNDPRIAVVVLRSSGDHDTTAEVSMNERLIDRGFRHVIDKDTVAGLKDAGLLSGVYSGRVSGEVAGIGERLGADFLVVGRSRSEARRMTLPDFKGGYYEHGMVSTGRAGLSDYPRVAVMPFSIKAAVSHNLDFSYMEAASDEVAVSLMNEGRFDVLERSELARVVDEQSFQMTDLADQSTAVEAGALLGAEYVLVGSITGLSSKKMDNEALGFGNRQAEVIAHLTGRGEDRREEEDAGRAVQPVAEGEGRRAGDRRCLRS